MSLCTISVGGTKISWNSCTDCSTQKERKQEPLSSWCREPPIPNPERAPWDVGQWARKSFPFLTIWFLPVPKVLSCQIKSPIVLAVQNGVSHVSCNLDKNLLHFSRNAGKWKLGLLDIDPAKPGEWRYPDHIKQPEEFRPKTSGAPIIELSSLHHTLRGVSGKN